MKIRIVKNKYLNALFLLMLFSAAVHMLILFFVATGSSNIYVLSYFNILDIDALFPNFLNNFWGNIISFISPAIIYLVILKINKAE